MRRSSLPESPVRFLTLFLKVVLFIFLLAFAIKNSEMVTVRYLMGLAWQAPLSLVLFLAFALGVLLGLLGCSRQILKNRRELARLRKAAGGALADNP
jgi:uncharacterized integral membrane protein